MENFRRPRASKVDGKTLRTVGFVEELNQTELADRLGVDQGTVSKWMTGTTPVPTWVQHVLSCRQCYTHFVQQGKMKDDR